ncbi:hypothetical protein [Streptomyces sp. NPDC005301]|uniref:hypothetical protein n=1 Tax=Streptomyces sp. NPDC005301 TaxID=3156874 RepID=UPI0033B5034A
MVRRRRTKKRPAFGIPGEVILLRGRNDWPYTFGADDARGGCGKVSMAAESAPEDVRAAVSTQLADLIRTLHGVEIDVVWSPLTSDSWVGRITPSDAP